VTPPDRIRLGDFLEQVIRAERVECSLRYRMLGVRLDGHGAYLREELVGTELAASRVYRVCAGDFIFSRLFAWRGAFAVVTQEHDGCYVSSEFPTFVSHAGMVDLDYLRYWFRQPEVLARVLSDCAGSTPLTRNRYKERRFLSLTIALPIMKRQRDVVSVFTRSERNVNAALQLRSDLAAETSALLASARLKAVYSSTGSATTLGEICSEIVDNLHSNPRYSDVGVPCVRSSDVGFGTLDLRTARTTDENEYRRRTIRGVPRLFDIVLVREGGGTGKCALVEEGQRFSLGQRVMMLRPDTSKVVPRFLLHQLLSPAIQNDQIQRHTKGSAAPHLNISALRKFPIKLPSIEEQTRIVASLDAVWAKIDHVAQLQQSVAVELRAVLPALVYYAFADNRAGDSVLARSLVARNDVSV
jgi:type I restriction enzyme S subunit